MDIRSFLIGALLVALVAGGYIYYEQSRNQVKIDGSGVEVQIK